MKDTEKIQKLISEERLQGYRGKNDNNMEACLKRYQYNIELSKEFYPLLHILEVGLRNSLYMAWAEKLEDDWILKEEVILGKHELDKISKAKDELKKRSKPIKTGRVMAELNFGFWTSLFNRPYEEHNRTVIKSIFPFAKKKKDQNLKQVRREINKLRHFRNRISHYEPIWHKNLEYYLNILKKYILLIHPGLMLKPQQESVQALKRLIKEQDVHKNIM